MRYCTAFFLLVVCFYLNAVNVAAKSYSNILNCISGNLLSFDRIIAIFDYYWLRPVDIFLLKRGFAYKE